MERRFERMLPGIEFAPFPLRSDVTRSIRMALGARGAAVVGMIVRHAVILAVIGTALGIAAALGFGRVLESQLFGVKPLDPLTLVTLVSVLCGTAAAASYLPARRAATLDPATTLRGE